MKDIRQEEFWTLSDFIILGCYNNAYKFEFIQIIMAKQVELEEEIEEFVSEAKGKFRRIKVDWQGLAKLRREIFLERDGSRSWQPLLDNLVDYLVEINILIYSINNSWTITGGGFDLSPKKPAPYPQPYFTRREDAEAYVKAFYQHLYTTAMIKLARETV